MARVAVVTGAAQGIGHRVATRLAGEGYSLGLIDSDAPALGRICGELRDAGVNAVEVVADVSVENEVVDAFDLVMDHFGGLDLTCTGLVPCRVDRW